MKLGAVALYGGLMLALLTVSGCATLNESECRSADWRTLGYEDGSHGYMAERIGQHRKACAKYGIAPELAAYQSGRDSGLREYCHAPNGFKVGAAGSSYNGVCPADLEDDFLDGYESGQHLHELRVQVSEVDAQIDSKRSDLSHADGELAHASATLIASDVKPEQRAQALLDARRLAEDVGRLKAQIEQLQLDLAQRQHDLRLYRSSLRYAE